MIGSFKLTVSFKITGQSEAIVEALKQDIFDNAFCYF